MDGSRIFHKNDIVRGRKFWERETLTMADKPKRLKEFEEYDVTNRLDKCMIIGDD